MYQYSTGNIIQAKYTCTSLTLKKLYYQKKSKNMLIVKSKKLKLQTTVTDKNMHVHFTNIRNVLMPCYRFLHIDILAQLAKYSDPDDGSLINLADLFSKPLTKFSQSNTFIIISSA